MVPSIEAETAILRRRKTRDGRAIPLTSNGTQSRRDFEAIVSQGIAVKWHKQNRGTPVTQKMFRFRKRHGVTEAQEIEPYLHRIQQTLGEEPLQTHILPERHKP